MRQTTGGQPSGILVMDKPKGISSAKLVAVVKRALGAGKVGHTGTLDPFATGVVVCGINQGTRLSQFLIGGHKTYTATLCLGVQTDTQDVTGTVTATRVPGDIGPEAIEAAMCRFRGVIQQAPPIYSALKHQGVALYKLARKGTPVQKPPRRVEIFSLELLERAMPRLRIRVSCSAGTYIRTLASDIGAALGCGAHLETLCRIESAGFYLEQALGLEQLEILSGKDAAWQTLISLDKVLSDIPRRVVDVALAGKIAHGQPMRAQDIAPEVSAGCCQLVDAAGRLLAVVRRGKNSGTYDYCCVFNR